MKKITLLLLMCFSSFLGFAQVALTEGFEGTALPASGTWALGSGTWAVFDNGVGTNNTWNVNTGTATPPLVYSGTRAAYMNGAQDNIATGSAQDWLVTPAVTVPTNGQLRFFTRQSVTGEQNTVYQIRVSTTSQTDASTFTVLQQWTETQLNTTFNIYEEKVVPLNLPAGSTVYVAFVMVKNPTGLGDRWFVDDMKIVQECVAPTNLGANAVTQSSANLTWTNPGGATSWEVEIVPSTTTTPSGHGVIYNGDSPYTATATATGATLQQVPFTANTEYKYYVRAVCSNTSSTSAWVGPFTFTTGTPGFTCSSAITVGGLPYVTTDNTSNYGDTTDVNQGTNCGSATNYMTGNDVFYSYTATQTGVISVKLTPTATSNTYSGLFVYNGCVNVGVSCIAGVADATAGVRNIPAVAVTAGQTYIIVVSTRNAPQTTAYTLNIDVVNCTPPSNLNATGIGETTATLTWDNPGNLATNWQVALQDAGAAAPTGAGTPVTTNTSYQPTLVPSHSYQYYVRAQCPDGSYSAWTGPYLFTTLQVPGAMPFSDGFESGNQWTLVNGTQANKWAVGTATNNGGANSMYVSNDNGVSNVYTLTTTAVAQAYRDIALPASTNEINIAFDWKCAGEVSGTTFYDYFRVWVVPTSYVPVAGTQIVAGAGRTQLTGNVNSSGTFTTSNYVYGASALAGQTMRLVFEWRNDGSGGTQPPAAIDNINVTAITCSAPSAIVVQTASQNGATVSWTAPANGASSYDYYVSTTNTAPTGTTTPTGNVTSPTVTLGSLQPSTTYYFWIRSNCGTDGTSTWTGSAQIVTTQIPGTLPYVDGFEGTTQWSLLNGTQTNKWVVGTAVNNGGAQSLYISNTNGTTNAYSVTATSVVQAYRDLTVPATANEINVAFDWRAVGEGFTGTFYDYFRVWAVPTSYVPTPGTQIVAGTGRVQLGANINNSATFATANYVLPATGFAGQTMRLVFEWRNDGSAGTQPPAAIDNVNISVITCSAPSTIVLNNVGSATADLSWTAPANGASSYDYYYSTTNTAPTGTTTPTGNVPTTNASLAGLQPSTTYYFWVRSNCGTDGTSTWTGPYIITTSQIPANLNLIEDFEGTIGWTLGNGTQVNKWIVGTATSNGGTHSLYISNNNAANTYTTSSTSVVHAYRDVQMPAVIGDMSLTFDWKAVGEGFTGTFYDYFRVWAVPTTYNPTPGTQITAASGGFQLGANFNNSSAWTTPNFIFDASQFSNSTMRLVFEWRNDGSGGTQPPAAIDNINLSLLTCPRPVNLLATSNTTNSDIVLTWTPVGTETSWEIVVQENGAGAPVSGQTVTSPTFTYPAVAGVFYEFYVRAICSSTDTSIWSGPEQFSIYSPPGCASVDLVGVGVDIVDQEIVLCAEEDNCVNLSATYFGIGATTSYTVEPIEYDPPFPFVNDNPADQISANTDDVWSPEKPLPFNFCFFGQNYDSCWISSNGVISFNPQTGGGFSSYTVPTTQIPTNQIHMNSIMLFQDIDPRYNQPFANISAKVLGTSPCRALVVNFNSVPYFNSNTNAAGMVINTYQMVLYEISNIIEIYVLDKPDPNVLMASPINGGRAVMGIQNADGTLGYAPPGRNTGVWAASQEAWRFSPSGESNVDFQWLKNGEFFSNDQDIEVCVTELTTMVAQATYATCSGEVITKENQVTIRTTEPLPTNDPVNIVSCSATGNPIFDLTPNTATIIGSNSATDIIIEYYLTQEAADLGDSSAAIQDPSAYAGTPGQIIYVRISYPNSNCYFVKTFALELGTNTPAVTGFTYAPVCIGSTTNPAPIPVSGFTTTGVYSSSDLTVNPSTGVIDLSSATAGTFDVTYTVTATGCNEGGSTTTQIVISPLPVADEFTDVQVCDSYVLPALSANNNYYTGADATGTQLAAGTVINTSQLIYVYASTGVNCSSESDFNVAIVESPIVSVTGACQGSLYTIEAEVLNETLSNDDFIFLWTDSSGNVIETNSPVITVNVSGTYNVQVSPVVASTVDCSVTQPFEANGTTCQIPKGISPNGDGKNDSFDLTGLQVRKISIFNRYGTVVYDFSNYTDQWHGQSNKGDELPDGTYFYSFEREGGESKTGWIYINRQRN